MMIAHLQKLFSRDLERLYQEIALYPNEAAIWKTEKSISNSAGNLCLHLIGNLNTYIGREMGGTGYVRNRELEFSQKDVPRTELLQKVEQTKAIVIDSLGRLNEKALEAEYPVLVFEEKTSTGYLLVHLAMHLSYHLGQINYHRRLIDTSTI
jgi:uncharacterized damage-inducible protein DinB